MQNEIICSKCKREYCNNNMPRLLTQCGHTFCQQCILNFIIQKNNGILYAVCPDDQFMTLTNSYSCKMLPKNIALMKMIQNKKDYENKEKNICSLSKSIKVCDTIEQQCETNTILNEEQIENEKESSIPLQSQKQLEESLEKERYKQGHKSVQKQKEGRQKEKEKLKQCEQFCKIHKKHLQIICTIDLEKICASCAIFGKHKGHTFKSIDEVTQIHKQYSQQINKLICQKQKIYQQINCTEIKNEILGLLKVKKNQLHKQIVEQFNNLQIKLAKIKKSIINNLDSITLNEEINLKNCITFSEELINTSQKWENKIYKQLQILEGNNFQDKLILLFGIKNQNNNIIQQGYDIIQSMKIEEEKILAEVQKKLENISLNITHQIQSKIQQFFQFNNKNNDKQTNNKIKIEPFLLNHSSQQILLMSAHTNYQNYLISDGSRKQNISHENFFNKKIQETTNDEIPKKTKFIVNEQNNLNIDESLLENEEKNDSPSIGMLQSKISTLNLLAPQKFSIRSSISTPQKIHINRSLRLNDHLQIKGGGIKMEKKKLKKMKIPQKYQKIVQSLLTNSLEVIDLTNAQLGDSNIAQICQCIGSKAQTLKLIRNKLTDEGIARISTTIPNIITLNLSQNLLTSNVLDILYDNRQYLPNLKTLILSQNKIIERKSKAKIDKMKKIQWNVLV